MLKSIAGFAAISVVMAFMVGCLGDSYDRSGATRAWANLHPYNLRTEYLAEPLGIDQPNPRLSWQLASDQRGQSQSAYRILVASKPENLTPGKADLWDSGKVKSDQTIAIRYQGRRLSSNQRCYWTVQVYDHDGKGSEFAEPAAWTMGFLQADQWQGQWIGMDIDQTDKDYTEALGRANWIWHDDFQDPDHIELGQRFFKSRFTLNHADIESAICLITADDAYELNIKGKIVGSGSTWRHLNMLDISEYLRAGTNSIAVVAENRGTPPANPAGLIAAITIEFADGTVKTHVTDSSWQSASGGGFTDAGPAAVIAPFGSGPWGDVPLIWQALPPARYLRKEFDLARQVKRAYVRATALGIYQLKINGQRITDDYFSPGWTDYNQRIYYRTYDVTDMLGQGQNAWAAVIAEGWYAGSVGWQAQRNHYGQDLRLLAQLNIEYEDGTTEVIPTDTSWKASLGPITQADFLMGETYDARLRMPGFDRPGFDDSAWRTVDTSAQLEPKIQAAPHQPVVCFEQLRPVEITEPSPGVYVFDMGQNFTGVVRINVQGSPGQKITVRHAERLQDNGMIYTENLRTARAENTYICDHAGTHQWQPYFTFHGFQYVELTGIDYEPDANTVTGLALSSDTPVVGSFECSNPMVNQLYSNIVWTERGNFLDIPTDCPQRDERLGWTGDAQVYIGAAAFNTDITTFFDKWLVDLRDAQREDGQFPKIAPLIMNEHDGGPAWADAGVICPWVLYESYGDKTFLSDNYQAIKDFIAFTENRSTEQMLPPEHYHCFGDWLNIDDPTPNDVIYMAYFAHSTELAAKIARELGDYRQARYYDNLLGRIKAAFNSTYIDDDGRIQGHSQTAYILALRYNLVEGENARLAKQHLIERIEQNGWHLSTGFVGTKDIMLVLAQIGRNDIAYRLLLNDTLPSWGFTIKHGATSIWERWNGWTPEQGFADPSMNSFAHYAFGAVNQWMFENIGGINNAGDAFRNIVIKPTPGGDLDYASVSYESIRGTIATDWKVDADEFTLKVTIPPNTSAMVYIPATDADSVTENGLCAKEADDVTFIQMQDDRAVFKIGSGSYKFQSRFDRTRYYR